MEQQVDNFDKHATGYREVHNKNLKHFGGNSTYFTKYKVDVLARFESVANLSILDLGCGDGVAEVRMKEVFPNSSIKAVEVSEKFIEQCRLLMLKDVSFDVYDGANIPFTDDLFDIVFIATVLHHVAKPLHAALFKEISRVLKPGGRVYIFEHNPFNPLTQYLVATCEFDEDAVLLRKSYLKKMLLAAGFSIRHSGYMTFLPAWKLFSVLLPLEKYLSWLPIGGQYFLCGRKPKT